MINLNVAQSARSIFNLTSIERSIIRPVLLASALLVCLFLPLDQPIIRFEFASLVLMDVVAKRFQPELLRLELCPQGFFSLFI